MTSCSAGTPPPVRVGPGEGRPGRRPPTARGPPRADTGTQDLAGVDCRRAGNQYRVPASAFCIDVSKKSCRMRTSGVWCDLHGSREPDPLRWYRAPTPGMSRCLLVDAPPRNRASYLVRSAAKGATSARSMRKKGAGSVPHGRSPVGVFCTVETSRRPNQLRSMTCRPRLAAVKHLVAQSVHCQLRISAGSSKCVCAYAVADSIADRHCATSASTGRSERRARWRADIAR